MNKRRSLQPPGVEPAPRGPRGRTKTCAVCGGDFTCGLGAASGDGCWCEDLPPLEIVDPAGDCRCPACLRDAVEAAASRRG